MDRYILLLTQNVNSLKILIPIGRNLSEIKSINFYDFFASIITTPDVSGIPKMFNIVNLNVDLSGLDAYNSDGKGYALKYDPIRTIISAANPGTPLEPWIYSTFM